MPSAKDFSECTLEAALDPAAAVEAITDDPGQVSKPPEAGAEQTGAGGGDGSAGGGDAGGGGEEEAEQSGPLTWVGVHLVNDKDEPVPDQRFTIKLPDGSTQEGVTDSEGKAKYEAVEEGSVEITWPDLHDEECDKV